MQVFLRQSLPVLFFHQKQELSDDEPEEDESEGDEDEEGSSRRSRRIKDNEKQKKDIEVKEEVKEMKDGRNTPPYTRDVPDHG